MIVGEATVFASTSTEPREGTMGDRTPRERSQGIPIWQRPRDGYWWADLRRFEDGGRESLGTRDRAEAENNLAERLRELREEAARREARASGDAMLKDFCKDHLERKKTHVADSTLANHERALGYLVTYLKRQLPRKPRLSDVTARRLSDYLQHRLESVKASTVGTELSAISSMLSRAEAWQIVDRNEARYVSAPKPASTDATWLEISEAARVLKAAKAMEAESASRCYPHLHALLATFLLTGGRRMEVYGLERDDVDLRNETVRFRPNDWRGLKTRHSKRTVTLWSQLRAILVPYLEAREDDHSLLFPARTGDTLNDLRSSLDTVQEKAKIEKHLTPKTFRHTYASTRIQTMDGGEPVSLFTVARELGHRGVGRVEDTYGHLQERRSRLQEVRYETSEVIDLEERRRA